MYETLRYKYMRPYTTSVCGLKLPVYETLRTQLSITVCDLLYVSSLTRHDSFGNLDGDSGRNFEGTFDPADSQKFYWFHRIFEGQDSKMKQLEERNSRIKFTTQGATPGSTNFWDVLSFFIFSIKIF